MRGIIGPILHPDFGDISMDVARELAQMTASDDAALHSEAEARQTLIAASAGQEGRVFKGGHQVAQIDARVHDYWRRREGADFWKHELKYMLKRHPELRVSARSEKPSIVVPVEFSRIKGRRGRWAA